jgi:hypothetical protein
VEWLESPESQQSTGVVLVVILSLAQSQLLVAVEPEVEMLGLD